MCGSYPRRASTSTTCEPMKPDPPVTRTRRPLPSWLALSVEVGMGGRSRRGGKTLVGARVSVRAIKSLSQHPAGRRPGAAPG